MENRMIHAIHEFHGLPPSRALRTAARSATCLLAAALLAACGPSSPPPPQAPSPVAATSAANAATVAAPSAASASATTCPAESFDQFLPLFENDVSVQKTYVTDPLQSDSVDPNADPEPKPVSKSLPKDQVTFPIMPSQSDQAKDGLTAKRTDTSATDIAVKLVKPDTDYQMTFFFRKDDCWHLYRVKDDSL
ncbi:hypothetical protein SAMN02800691_2679 [Luteibacter sp. UNCMF366Tsu5.1]|nr:hypothetical protein SAMN02800691_2679 [Luteibacter sp. UNCMF366Tsu5.1]